MEDFLSLLDPPSTDEKKIIPFAEREGDLLERHNVAMQAALEHLFGAQLQREHERKQLPLIKWSIPERAPGALILFCLGHESMRETLSRTLHEKITLSLIPKERARILSSHNYTFTLEQGEALYLEKLLIEIERPEDLLSLAETLPQLQQELRISSLSSNWVRPWFSTLSQNQNDEIYQAIFRLMNRYPRAIDQGIFRETQYYLLHYREEFRKLRSARHLCRLICAHYLFHRSLAQDIKIYPGKRHLYCKLLKTQLRYPLGLKRVLGIAIALNSLQEHECLEPRHILRAIQRIISSVRIVPDSFYSARDDEKRLLRIYLEVEKTNDDDFTLSECNELKKHLNEELRNSVEYLTPALFLPRNEEELLRNIILLSGELKYVTDLPQAIVSFQEQRSDVLKFNIILLRLLSKKTRPLQSHDLISPQDRLIIEKVSEVGRLRKRHVKEAIVFSLEIENRLFLRKNHSVDLLRARQYVVKTIERLVGPFRDYNGGFLHKQKVQLEAIRKALGEASKRYEHILENFFYSLSPPIMQTFLEPALGKPFFMLFLKLIHQEIPKGKDYLMETQEESDYFAIAIKSEKSEIKEQALQAISALEIEPLKLATATADIESHDYVCFLYLNPTQAERERFFTTIQRAFRSHSTQQSDLQVLRLHIPRTPQSLDPRIGGDRTSGVIVRMLYEGLMRVNKEGKPEFGLAESLKISEDRKNYRFRLKKTFWSNGAQLTAYDFEYAWKKILDPHFSCPTPYSFLFFSIKNAREIKQGELPIDEVGITALSERELVIELSEPFPYFISLLTHWMYAPLCREVEQKHPGWAYHNAETHVCNGPFKLLEWHLNDNLELERNPLYWDAKSVRLDKISIPVIEDENLAYAMFSRGNLDWHGDPVSKVPLKFIRKHLEQGEVLFSPISGLFWLHLNTQSLPFKTSKLRSAFSAAISRQSLIDTTVYGHNFPALGFRIKSTLLQSIDGDVERARLLFDEELAELGISLKDLPPILITHSEFEEHTVLSRAIGKRWEESFGIKVAYERLTWYNFLESIQNQDYMVAGLSWYPHYGDPLYHLELLKVNSEKPPYNRWKNARFSQLVEEAKWCTDPEKRERLIEEAEKIAVAEMPCIPLIHQHFRSLKNPRLKNVILSENGMIDFREAYFETQRRTR